MARLAGAIFISSAGDPLSLAVSLVLLYRATGSALSIAVAYLAQMVGILLVGNLVGTLADSADRRRLIVRLEAVRWVVVSCLPLVSALNVFLLLPALAILGGIETLVEPARQAGLAELVEPHELAAANSLAWTAMTIAQACGFAAAGIALGHLEDPRPLYFADAATFGIAGLLVATLGNLGGGVELTNVQGSIPRAWQVKPARPFLLLTAATVFVIGMLNPSLLPLAYQISGNGPSAYSFIQVFLILGVLGGSLAAGRVEVRLQPASLALGLWAFGLGVFAVSVTTSLWPALAAFALSGVGNALFGVGNNSMLMRVADADNRGTVMGARYTLGQASKAVGLGVGAAVTSSLGPHHAYAIMGAGLLAIAAACSVFLVGARSPRD